MESKKRALEIVESATGEVVKSVDVTGSDDRRVEKCLMGMLRNMDTERFFVRDTADAEQGEQS